MPRNGVDPAARFNAANLAFYCPGSMDRQPTFNLVYGVRAEAPHFFDKPAHTDSVAGELWPQHRRGTVELGLFASGRVQLERGRQVATQVRGGIGLFAGIPPYVWLANLYQNSGQGLAS